MGRAPARATWCLAATSSLAETGPAAAAAPTLELLALAPVRRLAGRAAAEPRLHHLPGRLWLLDSGRGRFGYLDLERGRFEPVAFCPGYARGLALHGDFAVVGLSKPRRDRAFGGLELDAALQAHDAEPRCGLLVVDLRTGDVVHSLRLEGVVEELYDGAVLPGVRRPRARGLKTDEIRRTLSVAPPAML